MAKIQINLTDAEVRETQDAMAKSMGITPETLQAVLAERRADQDRSRLVTYGVTL